MLNNEGRPNENICHKFNIGQELSGEEAKVLICYLFAEIVKDNKSNNITSLELYNKLNKFIELKVRKKD